MIQLGQSAYFYSTKQEQEEGEGGVFVFLLFSCKCSFAPFRETYPDPGVLSSLESLLISY